MVWIEKTVAETFLMPDIPGYCVCNYRICKYSVTAGCYTALPRKLVMLSATRFSPSRVQHSTALPSRLAA